MVATATACRTFPKLTSNGHELDRAPDALGWLEDSSDILHDVEALHERMRQRGHLFFRDLLHRDEVLDVRAELARRLMAAGHLDPKYPADEMIANPDYKHGFNAQLGKNNPQLQKVVYDGPMMEFFRSFFGAEVMHFTYNWMRAVAPGKGTAPHCDIVYMGRGTKDLYTAWTPLGDVDFVQGGLMVLEGSNNNQRLRETYCTMDVDTHCTNRPADSKSAKGYWSKTGGWLTKNVNQLRRAIGGRWLTTEYRAGDVLIFSVYTIHASVDNYSNKIRLSSDTRYQRMGEPADERWIGEDPIAHGPTAQRGRIC